MVCVKAGLLFNIKGKNITDIYVRFQFRIVNQRVQITYIFWSARFNQVLKSTTV
jgi:hypothetical protein